MTPWHLMTRQRRKLRSSARSNERRGQGKKRRTASCKIRHSSSVRMLVFCGGLHLGADGNSQLPLEIAPRGMCMGSTPDPQVVKFATLLMEWVGAATLPEQRRRRRRRRPRRRMRYAPDPPLCLAICFLFVPNMDDHPFLPWMNVWRGTEFYSREL